MPIIIGAHLNKLKNFYETIKQVELLKTTTLQIFTGSPQRVHFPMERLNINKIIGSFEDVDKTKKYVTNKRLKLFIHSPYILNFCEMNKNKIRLYKKILLEELELADRLGAVGCVIHMGKRKDVNIKQAQEQFVKCIQEIIKEHKFNTKIILETSAGQGSEIGYLLEEFAEIYNSFLPAEKKKIGLCIDTCHIFVAGEKIHTINGMKEYFKNWEELIGIKNITLFHLNDSKNTLGDRIDRHESISRGNIFKNIDSLKILKKYAIDNKIPLILETRDKTSDYSQYKNEIKLVNKIK